MKTYFINMEQATERREAMEQAFEREDLVRIDALDGTIWATGMDGRFPAWDKDIREKLVEQGVLAKQSRIPPNHLACNLSHLMAWEVFLRTGDDWCVVLEDDVEPTEALDGVRIEDVIAVPKGCGMFYLTDERSLPGRMQVYNNGQIKKAMTLAAYALNRRTAEIFQKALKPVVHLADAQLPICTFEGMQRWVERHRLQKFKSEKKVKACGMRTGGLVRHSEHARRSQLGHSAPARRKAQDETRD